MSNSSRFSNPFPQFHDASGIARNGATLSFYLTGSTTPSPAYTDAAHTTPAGTAGVVTLNSLGSSPTDLFLDPAITYKVVLKDSNGVVIWTADPYYDPLLNQQAKFAVYAGDPNGNVAGTAGTPGGTPADVIFDTSNLIIWVCTTTGNAATAVWTSTTGQLAGAVTFTGVISPTAIGTDQNNYSPTGLASASIIRQATSADCALTGLAGGSAGRVITIINIGTFRLTLQNNSGSSTAANAFKLGRDFYLDTDEQITLIYDAVSGRWRLYSTPIPHTVPPPQGRLTLASGQAMLQAEVAAGTSVYYTPAEGQIIPIIGSDGAGFVPTSFSELTLTLAAQHTASLVYDIFGILVAGRVILVTGPAWDTAGNYIVTTSLVTGTAARGTGAGKTQLSRVQGLWVNTVALTGARNGASTYNVAANCATYLGSMWMDGTNGQLTCHMTWGQNRKWGLWNAWNRKPIRLKGGDSTASWTRSGVFRKSNNTAANSITILSGLPEEPYLARMTQKATYVFGTGSAAIGLGIGSLTVQSGFGPDLADGAGGATIDYPLTAEYFGGPFLGLQSICGMEESSGTATFFGTETNMVISTSLQG